MREGPQLWEGHTTAYPGLLACSGRIWEGRGSEGVGGRGQ